MTTATYTKRILRVFDKASPSEIRQGVRWYSVARDEAVALSKSYGIAIETVIGVIAALSPNNRWERNLIDAENMIVAYLDGSDVEEVTTCTYKAMRQKAWDVMSMPPVWSDILDKLNGQKIKAFAQCIMGDDACCIDGHAYNIAMGERLNLTDAKVNVGVKAFRELQKAYSNAGKRRGFTAYEMQAITWVTWRNLHKIG